MRRIFRLSCVITCWFSVIILPRCILGINLDSRFTLVKKGQENSYFGYSVSQHKVVSENSPSIINERLLLVGAPKKEGGGTLYKCDAKVEKEDDCFELSNLLKTTDSSEDTSDQWLGVTVASQGQGKKVVACAHRYIKNNAALGTCYLLNQNLETEEGEDSAPSFIPCSKFSAVNFMQDMGLCQAGFSATFGQDDALLMGAPGSVFWQGVVFMSNVTDELGNNQKDINSPYKDTEGTTDEEQLAPTGYYSYNGYSVAMGKFDETNTLYFVSGAPASKSTGEVVFFTGKKSLSYNPDQIIQGQEAFSGFGSSLLAVDLNNDKMDDLIVGAPYYYERNHGGAFYVYYGNSKMITKETKPQVVKSRKMGEEECKMLKCEHARFGMALAKLGDLNMDGYQDFAVGAPYEGNGVVYVYHGSSSGFKDQFVQRIPASEESVLDGIISFGFSMSGGMDLDGNGYPDLTVGAYESDAVTLIRSRPIISLTPKMGKISLIDLDSPKQCPSALVLPENKNMHCFEVRLTAEISPDASVSDSSPLTILYSLEIDDNRVSPRAEVQDSTSQKRNIIESKLEFTSKSASENKLLIIPKEPSDRLNGIRLTYTFTLESDNRPLKQYPLSATENINEYPILHTVNADIGKPNTYTFFAEFLKNCGDDNTCLSNLQFGSEIKGHKRNKDGKYEIIMKSNGVYLDIQLAVSNIGEPAYETRIEIKKPGAMQFLGPFNKTSKGIDCVSTTDPIVCRGIGNPLLRDHRIAFVVRFLIPEQMAEDSTEKNITISVKTSSKEEDTLNDEYVHKFNVLNKANLILTATVQPDSSIKCSSEARSIIDMNDENDIGHPVVHTYTLENEGPATITESFLEIKWPHRLIDEEYTLEKYLLYLVQMPKVEGAAFCKEDKSFKDIVNPEDIKTVDWSSKANIGALKVSSYDEKKNSGISLEKLGDASQSREKRATRGKRETGNVVVLDCDDSTRVECRTYKCKIGELSADSKPVRITFHARLWESTLLSDFRKSSEVQIISSGRISVSASLKITQDEESDMAQATTRAIPDFKKTAGQTVAWWIYLVAILAGILLLIIVIFILYKVGFFRRKRPEDMQMYKVEKKEQAMLKDTDKDDV